MADPRPAIMPCIEAEAALVRCRQWPTDAVECMNCPETDLRRKSWHCPYGLELIQELAYNAYPTAGRPGGSSSREGGGRC